MELSSPKYDISFLAKLNPRQREAVECSGGPTLIIAGAGTGKTRTITCRIAKLIADGVPPWRILAVTFTNKAAGEMRERVEKLVPGAGSKVWIYTFHSFGARLLRQHAERLNLPRDFTIYDDDDQKKIIRNIFDELGDKTEKNKAGLYLNIISRAKDDMLDAQSYAIHSQTSNSSFRLPVADIYLRYEKKLREAGALDFGDLLLKTMELLRDKPDIREHYQEYFRHILVDEYQDTNRTQYIITKTLAQKHRNLCVVGDPDQSIYSWRGADIRNILEFEDDFKDTRVIALEQNYRSTANILNAADTLIRNNTKRRAKTLYTSKTGGDPVVAQEMTDERHEARWVADTITRLVGEEGFNYRDMAVFYRTNAQSRLFEESLRRAAISYRLVGTVRFYDRAEIKDALSYARLLVNPYDTVCLQRVINTPARGIGKTAQDRVMAFANGRGISFYEGLNAAHEIELAPAARRGISDFCNLLGQLRMEMNNTAPSAIMERLLSLSGYWESVESQLDKDPADTKSRLGNLSELVNAVKDYEERAKENATLSGFLEEVSLTASADQSSGEQNGVTLMTVHLAKGLEFPAVFLTGLEEGLFPIGAGNTSEDEMEEERRLCYVGMTRAMEQLYVTHTAARKVFGRQYTNLPSRFLFESRLMTKSRYRDEQDDRPDTGFLPPPRSQAQARPSSVSGGRVRHAVFGAGRIVGESGSGDNKKITVVFDSGKRQVFMLRYAPLEIL
ncbi:MAG: UvrD-helicase domain-containing protein [Elusimicrobiaceae bacterium]|nr:UvrD-helicase domain-containing protein [Elusimicrobiaceae bacterium]